MTQRRIYQREFPYFITTNIKERFGFFDNEKYALPLSKIIIEACKMKSFDLYTFCILSDHLHLLVKNGERALEKARCGVERGTFFRFTQRGFSQRAKFELSRFPQRGLSSPRGYTVSQLMQSIKGNFSRDLHIGEIWQPRFNFRIIDNEKRLINTINYILNNYKKHGLLDKYSKYPFQFYDENKINALFF